MIEVKKLTKEFPGVTPIKDLSVTINDGDVISIIGPSGTGKSTFIRCLNLLERPTSGQIIFDGENILSNGYDIKEVRKRIGMVFQSFNLFGHLTVIENLMIPQMDLLKKSKQEAYDTSIQMLRQVGLLDKALSYSEELSGGQKQRVAIARTLVMNPELILFDEPTSALDPIMVSEVQSVIRDLAKSGKTILIVTHEMKFAKTISNRVFYMDEGGIYEEGSPNDIFDNPKKEKTRRFVYGLKVLDESISSKNFDFIGLDARIEAYLMQCDASWEHRNHIRLLVEEVIQQILFPEKDINNINLVIEYSEENNECMMTVDYDGGLFNINDSKNEISLSVLRGIATDISYSYLGNEKLKNRVVICKGC